MSEPRARVVRGFRAVVPAELQASRAEARAIVGAARAEAAALREAAEAERAEALREAREEALAAAGVEAARIVADAEALAVRRLADLDTLGVEAVLAVAARVWRRAPADPAAAAREVALEIVEALEPSAVLAVRVHPDDAAALADLPLRVLVDPGLGRGDCVVACTDGERDGRAEVRARLALEHLAAALGRSPRETP